MREGAGVALRLVKPSWHVTWEAESQMARSDDPGATSPLLRPRRDDHLGRPGRTAITGRLRRDRTVDLDCTVGRPSERSLARN